jgi:DNA modification methylase
VISSFIALADAFHFMDGMTEGSVDLIISDGPYGITEHDWDKVGGIQKYNLELIKKFSRILKKGGSAYIFGKPDCIDFIDYRPYMQLNARIVWYQPSRLAQGRKNFTNNYDIIAYFSNGKARTFNLDEIRVPQMVELEHRKRVENVPSVLNGNYHKTRYAENGKNPGDVWGDIKQLTYKSKELVDRQLLNTIQKPERLIERLVKASSSAGDLVFDPFVGSGTTAVVCKKLNRNFIGTERHAPYHALALERVKSAGRAHAGLVAEAV